MTVTIRNFSYRIGDAEILLHSKQWVIHHFVVRLVKREVLMVCFQQIINTWYLFSAKIMRRGDLSHGGRAMTWVQYRFALQLLEKIDLGVKAVAR